MGTEDDAGTRADLDAEAACSRPESIEEQTLVQLQTEGSPPQFPTSPACVEWRVMRQQAAAEGAIVLSPLPDAVRAFFGEALGRGRTSAPRTLGGSTAFLQRWTEDAPTRWQPCDACGHECWAGGRTCREGQGAFATQWFCRCCWEDWPPSQAEQWRSWDGGVSACAWTSGSSWETTMEPQTGFTAVQPVTSGYLVEPSQLQAGPVVSTAVLTHPAGLRRSALDDRGRRYYWRADDPYGTTTWKVPSS